MKSILKNNRKLALANNSKGDKKSSHLQQKTSQIFLLTSKGSGIWSPTFYGCPYLIDGSKSMHTWEHTM